LGLISGALGVRERGTIVEVIFFVSERGSLFETTKSTLPADLVVGLAKTASPSWSRGSEKL
jgi:hypothetical protein